MLNPHNTPGKRGRSPSAVPGSPTGSSPKRAMSEDHLLERSASLLDKASNPIGSSGLAGDDTESMEEENKVAQDQGGLILGDVVLVGSHGPGSSLDQESLAISSTPKNDSEVLIDPDLEGSDCNSEHDEISSLPRVSVSRGSGRLPSAAEQLEFLKESHEAPLEPGKTVYLVPSAIIEQIIESANDESESTYINLDLTPLIDLEAYDVRFGGNFDHTRHAAGSEGGWRLRAGLVEYSFEGKDDKGKGKGRIDDDDNDDELDVEEPFGFGKKMVYLSENAWETLVSWYGNEGGADEVDSDGLTNPNPVGGIKRQVFSDASGFNSIELNPPSFIIHCVTASDSTNLASVPEVEPLRLSISAHSTISDLCVAATEAIMTDQPGKKDDWDAGCVRLWKLEVDPTIVGNAQQEDDELDATADRWEENSRSLNMNRIDEEDYDEPEAESTAPPDYSENRKPSSSPTFLELPSHLLSVCSAKLMFCFTPSGSGSGRMPEDLPIAELSCENGDTFAIEFGNGSDDTFVVGVNEAGLAMEMPKEGEQVSEDTEMESSASTSVSGSGSTAPAPLFSSSLAFQGSHNASASTSNVQQKEVDDSSMTAQTRSKTKSVTPGLRGLQNLGNTCFMNSALQCLSNTPELTQYILSGKYKDEINRDNPLGMHGRVADSFGRLLEDLWDPSGGASSAGTSSYFSSYGSNSVAPREFKGVIGRFAPQFAGYGQQDTQELIAFLLDGLHEDLNRIMKKPYFEKPDWKDGGGDEDLAILGKACWDGYKSRNDSIIVDLFQGQLKSTLICPACQKKSITLDPFMYLTVPIPVNKAKVRDVFVVPMDPSQQRIKVTVQYIPRTTFAEIKRKLGELVDIPPANLLAVDEFNSNFYQFWNDDAVLDECSDSDVVVFYEFPSPIKQKNQGASVTQIDGMVTIPIFTSAQGSHTARPFFITLKNEELKSLSTIKRAIALGYQGIVEHGKEEELFNRPHAPGVEQAAVPATSDDVSENVTELHINDDEPTSEPRTSGSAHSSLMQSSFIANDTMAVPREDLYSISFSNKDSSKETKGNIYRGRPNSHKYFYSLKEWRDHKKPLMTKIMNFATKSSSSHNEKQKEPSVSLLEQSDAIFIDWSHGDKNEFFGHDGKGRYRDDDVDFVKIVDPAVQVERKKAEVAAKKGITLDDCLDDFSQEETLGENDLWYCSNCKEHRAATKRMEIYQLPEILVICLKRFGSRGMYGKINQSVDFPISGLDLSDRCQVRQVGKSLVAEGKKLEDYGIGYLEEPLVYDLFAVDNHFGGLGGGHYTAHAVNDQNHQWYNFDDSSVRASGSNDLSGSSAYLLFYRRRTSSSPATGEATTRMEEAVPEETLL